MTAADRPRELEELPHPPQEWRNFHPADEFLRRHGFRIRARLGDAEAVWERGGRTYRQSAALALADREESEA